MPVLFDFSEEVANKLFWAFVIIVAILIIAFVANYFVKNDTSAKVENYIPDWLAYYTKVLEYKVPADSIYYEYYPNVNVTNGMQTVPQNYENSAYGYWMKI